MTSTTACRLIGALKYSFVSLKYEEDATCGVLKSKVNQMTTGTL